MSKYTWIIDAGHGGIDPNGLYVTYPNKMFNHGDFTIYEGLINRLIADKLRLKLSLCGVDFISVYHDIYDWSLGQRVRLANAYHNKNKNCIYLSIHSNAGGGKGNEIYTSVGETKSDDIAQVFCDQYKKDFPKMRFRNDHSDGDDDKESQFYVLTKTKCPALLVENGFFDNRKEAKFLMSDEGQERYAQCLFESIKKIEL